MPWNNCRKLREKTSWCPRRWNLEWYNLSWIRDCSCKPFFVSFWIFKEKRLIETPGSHPDYFQTFAFLHSQYTNKTFWGHLQRPLSTRECFSWKRWWYIFREKTCLLANCFAHLHFNSAVECPLLVHSPGSYCSFIREFFGRIIWIRDI